MACGLPPANKQVGVGLHGRPTSTGAMKRLEEEPKALSAVGTCKPVLDYIARPSRVAPDRPEVNISRYESETAGANKIS